MLWADMLGTATTEERVMALVRAFVGTFTPGELERLPHALRPGPLTDVEELRAYTARLVQYDAEASDGAGRIAMRLSSFLSSATARLRELPVRA